MKRRTIGILLLLVGSIALGLIAGHMDWILFRKAIPPTMASELNLVTVRGAAFSYGLAIGAALFVWGLLAAIVAPVFRSRKDGTG